MNSFIRILLLLGALAIGTAPLSGVACGVTKQATQSCECCQGDSCCVDGSKTDPVSTQPLNTTNSFNGKISLNVASLTATFAAYSIPQATAISDASVRPDRPAPDRAVLCTFLI